MYHASSCLGCVRYGYKTGFIGASLVSVLLKLRINMLAQNVIKKGRLDKVKQHLSRNVKALSFLRVWAKSVYWELTAHSLTAEGCHARIVHQPNTIQECNE